MRASCLAVIACLMAAIPIPAAPIYGSLSNFDVYNDTGGPAHGFEIELDGLSSLDILYSFSSNRYGAPQVVSFANGVYVRWESPYQGTGFTLATPMPPNMNPTGGHSCWPGASAPYGAQYPTAGCEHFGLSTQGNATGTHYRWLVEDAQHPGQLKRFGTDVGIPAPTWNVVPQPAQPPVVQAVIVAPPPEGANLFGKAYWVKVFVTEKPKPAELNHLVNGDPVVPGDSEVEQEWFLFQSGDPATDELLSEGQAGNNAESVIRRYEFYKFSGIYGPEGDAVCIDGTCSSPAASELGAYIGSQFAALNLVQPPVDAVPEPSAAALVAGGASLLWISRRFLLRARAQ